MKVTDIHHVRYCHSDLAQAEKFLTDFGFQVTEKTENALYLRGAGKFHHIYVVEKGDRPQFISVALQAQNCAVLDELATVPGASSIHDIEEPGGGYRVTLTDPNNFRIDVVAGIAEVDTLPMREPLMWNNARAKKRFGQTQRPPKQPAQVLRLGHLAIDVLNFEESYQWYTTVLGMRATDVVYYGHPSYKIAAFLRCNNGDKYVDHHTLAIAQSPQARVHHVGCEVEDFDSVKIGHDWLHSQGYQAVWGIGRHLLGSQIFDYWQDPFGSFIKHFTDGDLFNEQTEATVYPGSLDILYQWGGPVPQTFLG
jgi:catechol 2,3-dioxygenase-like lactoylglutathione lyase family enzyme